MGVDKLMFIGGLQSTRLTKEGGSALHPQPLKRLTKLFYMGFAEARVIL